jgi:hypothetical protein
MSVISEEVFEEYKRQLDEDGYAIIKGAVDPDKAEQYAQRFWDYLENLSKDHKIDRNDTSTWKGGNWMANLHGILKQYNVGHAQFIWDVRDEDGIVSFFEQLWETNDLLVSFDGACMIRPTRNGSVSKWAHTDQAPFLNVKENNGPAREVRDFGCVQGLLNLKPCGPNDGGLVVYKGSHKGHQQFFIDKGTMTEEEKKRAGIKKEGPAYWKDYPSNWYKLDHDNEIDAAHLAKYERIKVCCDPGDFLVWSSRTLHYAEAIDTTLNDDPAAHRMCVYVCMLPKKYATTAELKKKKEALNTLRTTSHWPCIKLSLNPLQPRTYGSDKRVVEDFVAPDEYPVLTDRMKKLAGVESSFQFTPVEKTQATPKKRKSESSADDKKQKRQMKLFESK